MFGSTEVIEVIRQYNLRVGSIETYPSFFKLSTNLGMKKLNKWDNINLMEKIYHYQELIAKAGFRKTDRFILTKEGLPYVIKDKMGYSLSDFIEGRIASLKDEKDLESLSKTFASYRQVLTKIKINKPINLWSKNYFKSLKYFNDIEEKLKNNDHKSELDELLLSDLPMHKKEILLSVDLANKVEKIASKSNLTPTINHGNLNLDSFMIDHFDECWVVDFSAPIIDIKVYDLAKFIRKTYKENDIELDLVYKLLNYYQEVEPLNLEDELWILTYLAYPHEVWKFVYIYYYSKTPHPKNIVEQYLEINMKQMRIGRLYQGLYDYFEI